MTVKDFRPGHCYRTRSDHIYLVLGTELRGQEILVTFLDEVGFVVQIEYPIEITVSIPKRDFIHEP
jgi:hypothetical protein